MSGFQKVFESMCERLRVKEDYALTDQEITFLKKVDQAAENAADHAQEGLCIANSANRGTARQEPRLLVSARWTVPC